MGVKLREKALEVEIGELLLLVGAKLEDGEVFNWQVLSKRKKAQDHICSGVKRRSSIMRKLRYNREILVIKITFWLNEYRY